MKMPSRSSSFVPIVFAAQLQLIRLYNFSSHSATRRQRNSTPGTRRFTRSGHTPCRSCLINVVCIVRGRGALLLHDRTANVLVAGLQASYQHLGSSDLLG